MVGGGFGHTYQFYGFFFGVIEYAQNPITTVPK